MRLKGLLLLPCALLSAKPQRTTEAPQPHPWRKRLLGRRRSEPPPRGIWCGEEA
ncbi:hypothetical protein HMPREF3185_01417 [Porphyromonas somerae]|uniref:Uncharacterized protein n=1 Tax=Porphyromonas somerae TaxID=322095 RepID=A0A134B5Z4_9PORP|nr:hypothetical protein HMPREF3184_01417 [Porphyromonadaceae bacterium KA00676]KXB75359.1 hypothetical protein HMPREF3185_01417 [Porphyromonas somerae]